MSIVMYFYYAFEGNDKIYHHNIRKTLPIGNNQNCVLHINYYDIHIIIYTLLSVLYVFNVYE